MTCRLLKLLCACLLLVPSCLGATQYGPSMIPLTDGSLNEPLFSFTKSWKVLGPFQVGTREATWGADPLEYTGGFINLTYDAKATFHSSLPANGTAVWNTTKAEVSSSSNSANASLSVTYSNVDWDFLKVVYGWAAVQYQAWARGELTVYGNEPQHVILHTDAILEYWVDGDHFFGGDFYSFRKAPPVLHLKPGRHQIDLRLVRDVRAFGGIAEPTIDVLVDVRQVSGTLELAESGFLVADAVNGKLASPIASVLLRNSGKDDIEVLSIERSDLKYALKDHTNTLGIVLVAGQTRPVAFNVSLPRQNATFLSYDIRYRIAGSNRTTMLHISQNVRHASRYQPHKMTFMTPSGSVSYAMLRAPALNATCGGNQRQQPVLLILHGAGVEVDNTYVTDMLDPVSDLCAWVLLPSGSTPWSGDDWHNWGFADVEAAIDSIPIWMEHVKWKGPGININRWIVVGHSNGGQGVWHALTARSDKILAAAPLSGYASIQKYVSYELWQPADPRRTAIISASLNNYRHEMLMANARGTPIQQQHGGIDDNVPTYNSRLLSQQLYLANVSSHYVEYNGRNHVWDGMLTTPELMEFYHKHSQSDDSLPRRLENFSIVVGDPGDMGSKGGTRVTQLLDPGQYGRVDVKGRVLKTFNVQSLQFDKLLWAGSLSINGLETVLSEDTKRKNELSVQTVLDKSWEVQLRNLKTSAAVRSGRQLGSMSAILRTEGPFIIQHFGSDTTSHLAVQTSRNLYQYFQADAVIVVAPSSATTANMTGNIITLAIGSELANQQSSFPIHVDKTGATVRDHDGHEEQYGDDARAAAFLRPAGGERLELVLWGIDSEGLRQAARLVPLLTGVGQPDFVVLRESAKWQGIEAALAMGFFDSNWEVAASSVVENR